MYRTVSPMAAALSYFGSSDWVPEVGNAQGNAEIGRVVPEGESIYYPPLDLETANPVECAPQAAASQPPAPPTTDLPMDFYLVCRRGAGGHLYSLNQRLKGGDILSVVLDLEDESPHADTVLHVEFDGVTDVTDRVARAWWGRIGSTFRWGKDNLPYFLAINLPEVSRRHDAHKPVQAVN